MLSTFSFFNLLNNTIMGNSSSKKQEVNEIQKQTIQVGQAESNTNENQELITIYNTLKTALCNGNLDPIRNTFLYQEKSLIQLAFTQYHILHWYTLTACIFKTSDFNILSNILRENVELIKESFSSWNDSLKRYGKIMYEFEHYVPNFAIENTPDYRKKNSCSKTFMYDLYKINPISLALQIQSTLPFDKLTGSYNNIEVLLQTLQYIKNALNTLENNNNNKNNIQNENNDVKDDVKENPPEYQDVVENNSKKI